jgi:NAD(P)-dependent dehydrogenase (short-subunit alcohol dehydrogenase family)
MGDTGVLAGKSALVTGGAGGIGSACARSLLRDGAAVMLMGRRTESLEQTRADLIAAQPGARVEICAGDGRREEDVQAALDAAHAMEKRLDIVVTTVGYGRTLKSLRKLTVEEFRAALDYNLVSAFIVVRHAIPLMTDGGSIVCISSSAPISIPLLQTPYSTAKGGLETFVRSAAKELARAKIRVNAVRPGLTQSGGGAQLILSDDKLRERTLAMIPFNRAGTPDEVAAAVRYLAGPESGYTTGQSFAVDGGLELGATNAGHG